MKPLYTQELAIGIIRRVGQVPYRDFGEDITKPTRIRNAADEVAYLISELTAIIPDLPTVPAYQSNKNAPETLSMKVYLNKGAFFNRITPALNPQDMTKVISLADEIYIGGYTLMTNYFDNFAPTNDALSTENLLLRKIFLDHQVVT